MSNEDTSATPTKTATTFSVAGKEYEMAGISAAQGMEIYSKLTPEYQNIADNYARLAKIMRGTLDIDLPTGMSFKKAWDNTLAAVKARTPAAEMEPYKRQIIDQFGLEGAVVAAGGMGAAAGAAWDMLALLPRTLGAAGTVVGEAWTTAKGALTPVSDDQAKAFGAVMAGAAMYEAETRQGMSTGSKIWNYPGAHAGASLEYAVLNVPVLNSAWPYIKACWQMVEQWFSKDASQATKSFSEFVEQNKQEAAQAHADGQDTYQALVDRRARGNELDRAAAKMTAAETVAGIATKEVVEAAQNDNVVRGPDGAGHEVTADRGHGPQVGDGAGIDPAQRTMLGRMAEATKAPFRPIVNGLTGDHAAAYALTGVAVGLPLSRQAIKHGPGLAETAISKAQGAAHGVAHAGRGAASGFLQGSADMLGGKPFRQAHSMLNRMDGLKAGEARALEHVRELEDAGSKTRVGGMIDRVKLGHAERKWESITRKIGELETKIQTAPAMPQGKLAAEALKTSDMAHDVMKGAETSRVGRVARGLGRVAPWLTAGFFAKDTFDGVQALHQGKGREAAASLTSAGTVAGGAAVGAAVGSAFFGIGAIPGAAAGAGLAGLADLTGGIFGVGAKEVGGKIFDYFRPTAAAADPQAAHSANMRALAADPDIKQFCEAVVARDPGAMRMLMGNDSKAHNARIALQACGVKIGAVITPPSMPAANNGSKTQLPGLF